MTNRCTDCGNPEDSPVDNPEQHLCTKHKREAIDARCAHLAHCLRNKRAAKPNYVVCPNCQTLADVRKPWEAGTCVGCGWLWWWDSGDKPYVDWRQNAGSRSLDTMKYIKSRETK